jgi:hypothetical protein
LIVRLDHDQVVAAMQRGVARERGVGWVHEFRIPRNSPSLRGHEQLRYEETGGERQRPLRAAQRDRARCQNRERRIEGK